MDKDTLDEIIEYYIKKDEEKYDKDIFLNEGWGQESLKPFQSEGICL